MSLQSSSNQYSETEVKDNDKYNFVYTSDLDDVSLRIKWFTIN